MIRAFPSLLLGAISLAHGFSQEPKSGASPPPQPPASAKKSEAEKLSHEALNALALSLAETRKALKDAHEANDTESIANLEARLKSFTADLERVATGQDSTSEAAPQPVAFNLQGELIDLLKPLVEEVKAATKSPRDAEQLRTEIASLRSQLDDANNALARLRVLGNRQDVAKDLAPFLTKLTEKWDSRRQSVETTLSVSTFKLAELEAARGNIIDSLSEIFSNFFQTRGLNLLAAITAAALPWLTLSWIRTRVEKLPSFRKRKDRSFSSRAASVLFLLGSTLAAIVAVLMVFYIAGDWVLLGLSILLLLGIVWAGKTTLPRFFNQVKLMLNLGSVREGERVVIDGVPWEVKRLNVFSELTNPALEGGTLRLPIRDILPLTSRPFSSKEPWFPSSPGDWVRLNDDHTGKVIIQSPEWVQIILLGGSRKTYATSDFVASNPESLTHNFRVRSIFGIDYAHQAISTTEVPKIFTEHLLAELRKEVGAENVVSVIVEFASAGASSLDYEILANFSGNVSAQSERLERSIQRLCVDVCNAHKWEIPFTQITMHNA